MCCALVIVLDDDEESASEETEEEEAEGCEDTGETHTDLASLLAHLELADDQSEAAAKEELDLDELRPFQSWWIEEIPKLFPRLKTLSLQNLGLKVGMVEEVGR